MSDRESHVCKRCLVALDFEEDGRGWIHPISQEQYVDGVAGHEPEPVLASSVLEHRYRCDFCFAPDPAWSFPARDFMFPEVNAGSEGDWAACDLCAELIERDAYPELIDRAMASTEGVFATMSHARRREMRPDLLAVYRQFAAARCGPGKREVTDRPGAC